MIRLRHEAEVVVSTGVVGSIDSVEEKMSEGRLLGLQGPAATEAAKIAATNVLDTILVRILTTSGLSKDRRSYWRSIVAINEINTVLFFSP